MKGSRVQISVSAQKQAITNRLSLVFCLYAGRTRDPEASLIKGRFGGIVYIKKRELPCSSRVQISVSAQKSKVSDFSETFLFYPFAGNATYSTGDFKDEPGKNIL